MIRSSLSGVWLIYRVSESYFLIGLDEFLIKKKGRRSLWLSATYCAAHSGPGEDAEFYKQVFDMVEVGRTDSPIAKGIYLSDGTINLAVLRFKTKEAADRNDGLGPVFGLHHFGFWVETRMRRAAG